MTVQHEYSLDETIVEQDYHPFRTDDIYHKKGNHKHFIKKHGYRKHQQPSRM